MDTSHAPDQVVSDVGERQKFLQVAGCVEVVQSTSHEGRHRRAPGLFGLGSALAGVPKAL
jgi:hypothetical protein